MFEIGFWELALLFALGLIVLGPEKLPRVAAQLGRYAGQARRMARTLGNQIRDELEAEESRIHEQQRHHPPAADADADSDADSDPDVDIEAAADAAATDTDTGPVAARQPEQGGSEQQELPLESAEKPAPELQAGSQAGPDAEPTQARPAYSRPGVDDLIPKGERSPATPTREVAADSRDPS